MTILVAHNRYRVRGGEDSVFEAECRLLEDAGHRVVRYEKTNDSIVFDRVESPKSRVAGPKSEASSPTCDPEPSTCDARSAVRKLRAVGAKLALALRTIWNPRTVREVRALIRAEKPDVVHCHNTFPLISPSIYYAAAREGVPVVQTLHNYRLSCLNGYFFREGKVCEKCLGRTPWCGLRHRCYRDSLGGSLSLFAMIVVHRLLGTWRRKVTRYVALTDFARDKFVAAGLQACKLVVKPNAFAPAQTRSASESRNLGISESRGENPRIRESENPALRVVYLGRLSPEKGVDVLLRAWALLQKEGTGAPTARPPDGRFVETSLPDQRTESGSNGRDAPMARPTQAPRPGPAPTCVIIGDGPDRAALEGLAAELGIASSVRFLGALPRSAALAELASASLLVFPSLWFEQFAVTPLEAMALGVPVLVSGVARSGTMIEDDVTGRFFRAGDPAALAAALRELLADPAALRRMGSAARAAFEASDCRPDRNLARLLAIYASARSAPNA